MADIGGFVPFIPDADPYLLPPAVFDALDEKLGQRFSWFKSHQCPCVYSGDYSGSPQPRCRKCKGLGWYWDAGSDPFMAHFIYVSRFSTQAQPGVQTDTDQGQLQNAQPSLTIPQAAGTVWDEASLMDIFVELDASTRYNQQLRKGGIEAVPYQQILEIPVSGAVTIWDQETADVISVSGYTVSGATVLLPDDYPEGTAYVVEFTAAPNYVAYRKAGGVPHIRPFASLPLPRRFQLQQLDLWLRAQNNGQYPVVPAGT